MTIGDSHDGARRRVPSFMLYGDNPGASDPPFVHIETVETRSRAVNWHIEPHRHDSLGHILLIRSCHGRFLLDDVWHDFGPDFVLSIPSKLVHAFDFEPGTDGLVLTLSDSLCGLAREGLVEAGLAAELTQPRVVDLSASPQSLGLIRQAMRHVEEEMEQPRIGQLSAIRSHISLILLTLLRHERFHGAWSLATSHDLALVDRLRQMIARELPQRIGVRWFAERLGVAPARLNAACRKVAGCSTLHLLHSAKLAEAKRSLLYTALPISEIAYDLGFDDPAYFSRFFTQRTGRTPTAFRALHIPVGEVKHRALD